MHLIIDQYATVLSVENNLLKIKQGEMEREIHPNKISALHLFKPCSLSSPLLALLAEHQLPCLIYDNQGKVKARVWSPYFGSISGIRIGQTMFVQKPDVLIWIKGLLKEKAEGQLNNLRWLQDRRPGNKEELNMICSDIESSLVKLDQLEEPSITKQALLSAEAQLSKTYWNAFALVFDEFKKRSKRPAEDRMNVLLNYAYGILYGMVEGALLAAGVDPHIGVLHADEYNRPSFVFDCIEPYRPWADRLVMQVIMNRVLTDACFENDGASGIKLTSTGKKIYIPIFFDYFHERTLFRNKKIKRKDQIQYFATQFAQQMITLKKEQDAKTSNL